MTLRIQIAIKNIPEKDSIIDWIVEIIIELFFYKNYGLWGDQGNGDCT